MADITDPNAPQSPGPDDPNNSNGADNRGIKRPRVSTAADDDDDDDDKPGRERRKIDIKFIQDKSRRHITFSKRKAGIMKKVSTHLLLIHCAHPNTLSLTQQPPLGIRTLSPDRYPSAAACRLRDGARLHLHHSQTPAPGHQSRGQESYPGKLPIKSLHPFVFLTCGVF